MQEIAVKNRIQSIDLLRGIVMIVMALDHCRDFLHIGNYIDQDPLDFETTTPFLFLTRWITHYCAPVFVFLSGTSIFFMSQRKSKTELFRFLFTRGLWLIIMELTIINWGWAGNLSYAFAGLQVIWAIGISMVFFSGLIFLPGRILAGLGLLIVFGHNLFDSFDFLATDDFSGFMWALLHTTHIFKVSPTFSFAVFYPFVPWLGLMICGYGLGQLYAPTVDRETRKRILLYLGFGCILLFLALRSGNFYGDSFHWKHQATSIFTLLSFVDTTKYPPSLLYMLMTIGPALIFLAVAENLKNALTKIIVVFGRVPFFYYILHLYLFHFMAVLWYLYIGNSLNDLHHQNFGGFPDGFGLELGWVYLAWFSGVTLLYFPCRWYDSYKTRHPEKRFLSYL